MIPHKHIKQNQKYERIRYYYKFLNLFIGGTSLLNEIRNVNCLNFMY